MRTPSSLRPRPGDPSPDAPLSLALALRKPGAPSPLEDQHNPLEDVIALITLPPDAAAMLWSRFPGVADDVPVRLNPDIRRRRHFRSAAAESGDPRLELVAAFSGGLSPESWLRLARVRDFRVRMAILRSGEALEALPAEVLTDLIGRDLCLADQFFATAGAVAARSGRSDGSAPFIEKIAAVRESLSRRGGGFGDGLRRILDSRQFYPTAGRVCETLDDFLEALESDYPRVAPDLIGAKGGGDDPLERMTDEYEANLSVCLCPAPGELLREAEAALETAAAGNGLLPLGAVDIQLAADLLSNCTCEMGIAPPELPHVVRVAGMCPNAERFLDAMTELRDPAVDAVISARPTLGRLAFSNLTRSPSLAVRRNLLTTPEHLARLDPEYLRDLIDGDRYLMETMTECGIPLPEGVGVTAG